MPTRELGVPAPAAGARRWTAPPEPLLRCERTWKDSSVPMLGEGCGLFQHRLSIKQAWLSSLQSCYLCIFNTKRVCIWFFCVCIYSSMHLPGKKPALGECGIYCNSSPGMIFNTFQFYYLNSGYWIFKAL